MSRPDWPDETLNLLPNPTQEMRAGSTGSLLPVPPARRFRAVKIRDCRLYTAKGRYEDPALPIIQSLPVAIP